MSLIQESVKREIEEKLKTLPNSVRLVAFTQELDCQFCRENLHLAEEVAALSNKVKLEVYNFVLDKDKVEEFKVERVPALVVAGERDYGIRFYGVPAGYEFTSLVNAIQMVGSGDSGLKSKTKEQLAQIEQPVKIDVFITLSCPHCPRMVSLAHRFAVESEKITASGIDAEEFPVLANYYDVMAVPKTVLNQRHQFEGAVPEERLLEELLKVVGSAVNA